MRAERSYTKAHAILVTPEHLKYFAEFLGKYYEEVAYKAYCSDGTDIEFSSIQELLSYENPSFKSITRITLKGQPKDYKHDPRLSLELGDVENLNHATAYYFVSYSDLSLGISIERELQQRIRELRPWYWWIVAFSFKSVILGIYMTLAVLLLVFRIDAMLSNRFLTPPRQVDSDYVLTWVLATVVPLGGLISLSLVDKFKAYFFPKVVFCLGKQATEFERRQKRWSFIFSVIVVGLILNVIGSVIFAQLFSR